MATLEEIVAAVQAALADLDVSSIPATPPENLGDPQLPALVVYPATGGYRIETAMGADGLPQKWGTHTINVDFHVGRTDLAVNVAAALPFCESIANALLRGFLGGQFGGTVTTLGQTDPPLRYALAEMDWGGRKKGTVGWRFELDVTAESDIA